MLANQHVRFGERVTGDPTRGNRSLLDLKVDRSGWKSAHRLFLPNYGSSTSSPYGAHTQKAAYRGVEEAAGF